MALARKCALSRPARLAKAIKLSCRNTSAFDSRQISSSTAVMDLQSSVPHEQLVKALQGIVPSLTNDTYKGQSGKVGVIGGCREYTGAPYFAAMSSLRMGCDLAYVFCTPSAAPVIKGYSPELIVVPELIDGGEARRAWNQEGASDFDLDAGSNERQQRFLAGLQPWLQRLSVLIIGPGLGDDPCVGDCMLMAVQMARNMNVPTIIDGSGLNFVAENPECVRGFSNCLLTPNIAEFGRLAAAVGVQLEGKIGVQWQQQSQQLAAALGGPILLSKGPQDVITDGQLLLKVSAAGSPRRCGGQGDVLTGTTAAFISWALAQQRKQPEQQQQQQQEAAPALPPLMLAAYAGCLTMRAAALLTFKQQGRSMVAEDMIKQLGDPVLQHAGLISTQQDQGQELARL